MVPKARLPATETGHRKRHSTRGGLLRGRRQLRPTVIGVTACQWPGLPSLEGFFRRAKRLPRTCLAALGLSPVACALGLPAEFWLIGRGQAVYRRSHAL